MNNMYRLLQSSRIHLLQRGLLAAMAVLLVALPVASNAQEIDTAIRGSVTTPDGGPAAGLAVTITDTRTNARRSTTTSSSGAFSVRGLAVGGPYTIRVSSDQHEDTLVTDVHTDLSSAASFNIVLEEANAQIEEIVVTSAMVASAPLAIGPGSSFSLAEIEAMPSSARQIRDIVRIDPRVTLGRTGAANGPGIFCMGGNARNNAMTIDGLIASDGFGLNASSGTAARFSFPVPYDTIASASVEFAPLDVQYSQFTGCAINIVTKGGTNEFHGSAFYLFNDEGLTGTKIEGETVLSDPFEDTNYGVTVSGPIIKDKLFFTVSYEKVDDVGTQNTGPTGGGFANELDYIDVDTVNEIADILRTQYDRDPGVILKSLPQETERLFARFDWNINDSHRAEIIYTDLDELNVDPDDCCFNYFTMSDNFEFEGTNTDTISARLISNWTDNISTSISYSLKDVNDLQGPVGGGEQTEENPIARIQVNDGAGGDIFVSGPGNNRSANDLEYEVEQFKLSMDWVLGDHTLTLGVERESRDIYNLYIFNATGTITFDDIDALRAGSASGININGSYTQDPLDASATFGRDVDSYYVQDEWQVNDAITLIAGIRFDEYKSSDVPVHNPNWEARYGFTNQTGFDGLDLTQPRIGMTWDLPTSNWGSTQLSFGFGIFGGGDPTVHFANSFQNFGGAIGNGSWGTGPFDNMDDPCTIADVQVTDANGQYTGFPECALIAAQNQALAIQGSAAAIDPNYELPTNERYSIGLHHITETSGSFWNNWEIRFDYIYTEHKNSLDWVDLRLSPNGVTLPDGRAQFFEVDPLLLGCTATLISIREGFANAGTNGGLCAAGGDNQDLLMTNGVEGETDSVSIQFSKTFDISDSTTLSVGLGYSYLDSTVGNPVTSFTAGSSYENTSKQVINNVGLGPSIWARKHNIVLTARYKHYWNDNNSTSFGLFFNRSSGRPYSYAYEDGTVEDLFGDSDNEENILLYVPTGPGDMTYDFTTNLGGDYDQDDIDAFFALLDSSGLSKYAGSVSPKNPLNGKWFSDLDLRISQEIGIWKEHTLQIFLDIDNVLNLFTSSGNIRTYNREGDVPETIPILQLDDNVTNVYVVEDIILQDPVRFDVDDTLYRIQLGVAYRF